MIDIVNDPLPSDEVLRLLWRKAWGNAGAATFQPILQRGLGHVGAYDGETLVGFVNVAWDGGVHGFILDTCVDRDYQRQGIATRLVQAAVALATARGAQWLHAISSRIWRGFIAAADFGRRRRG